MTFFMIGGIVFIIVAVLCVVIYFIAHKINEKSLASKIIIWCGLLFGVAGASLLTIEYSFPNISHPKKSTVLDRFVSFYGDDYKTFIGCENVIYVNHTKTNTQTNEDETKTTYFLTRVIYEETSAYYDVTLLNAYTYNSDYSYQFVTSNFLN